MTKTGPELLMIRRKDSLGFVEMMRGKYPLPNKQYILNILNEMTISERERVADKEFSELWKDLWGGNVSVLYRSEEKTSKEKLESLKAGINVGEDNFSLDTLLKEVTSEWEEAEWGFPKGRRNYQEKDISCALREFEEETGIPQKQIKVIQNILPFDEIFAGSNYKNYKHRYYLAVMNYDDTLTETEHQRAEVSKLEWMAPQKCLDSVRGYNSERKRVIQNVVDTLRTYRLCNMRLNFD